MKIVDGYQEAVCVYTSDGRPVGRDEYLPVCGTVGVDGMSWTYAKV